MDVGKLYVSTEKVILGLSCNIVQISSHCVKPEVILGFHFLN